MPGRPAKKKRTSKSDFDSFTETSEELEDEEEFEECSEDDDKPDIDPPVFNNGLSHSHLSDDQGSQEVDGRARSMDSAQASSLWNELNRCVDLLQPVPIVYMDPEAYEAARILADIRGPRAQAEDLSSVTWLFSGASFDTRESGT